MSDYLSSVSLTLAGLVIWTFILFICILKGEKNITNIFKWSIILFFPLMVTEFLYPYLQINYPEQELLIKILGYINIYTMSAETVNMFILTIFLVKSGDEEFAKKLSNKKENIIRIIFYIIPLILILLTREIIVNYDTLTHVYFIDGKSYYYLIYYDALLILGLVYMLIRYKKAIKNLNLFAIMLIVVAYIAVNAYMLIALVSINDTVFFFAALFLTILLTFESQDNSLLYEYKGSKKEAEDLNRNKTKFLINISHQIRTPMSTIMGFSDLISTQEATNEDINMGIESIHSASKELYDLVENILDVSKIDSGKLIIKEEEYDIQSVISEIQSNVLGRINNINNFTITYDNNIPRYYVGDKEIIFKILSYTILYILENTNNVVNLNISGNKENNKFNFTFQISYYGKKIINNNISEDIINYANSVDDREHIKLIVVRVLTKQINGNLDLVEEGNKNIYKINLSQVICEHPMIKEGDAK